MTSKKENEREALLAELELHKLEFSGLRQELLQLSESERQYLNLSIVAIGAGLGLSSYVISQNLIIVLLLFPFVFHVLLWERLKSWRSMISISKYLLEILIPRVNYIVNELGNPAERIRVFQWEAYISSIQFMTKEERVLMFLSPSGHFIPVIAVGVLIIGFLLASNAYGRIPGVYELGLIFLNLGLLILAAIQIISHNRSEIRKSKISN